MHLGQCVCYSTSIKEADAKCYKHDKIAPRLISSTCICLLSLRLVDEIPHSSGARF